MSRIKKNLKKIISSVLAFAMVFGMGFSAVTSVAVEASDVDTTDDGKYTVTLADAENGKIEFKEESDGRFSAGDTVGLKLIPDEGYAPAGVVIGDASSGDVITSKNTSDDLFSFTMPEADLYVSASFNELPEYQEQGTNDDEYLYDPNIESYIRENLNPSYVNYDGSTFALANLMTVKQSLFDKNSLEPGDTLDSVMTDIETEASDESFDKFIVMFTNDAIPVYDVDAEADYFVAYADTMHDDDNSYVQEAYFANNNNNGEVLESCIYDFDTGIVYLPKDIMIDEDAGTLDINIVQVQFMQVYDMGGEDVNSEEYYDADIDVESLSEAEDEKTAKSYKTSTSLFDTTTTVKVESGMDSDKLVVTVNGVPMKEDSYDYDAVSGYITVAESPAMVQSVIATEEESTLGEKLSAALDSVDVAITAQAVDSWDSMYTWASSTPVQLNGADGIQSGSFMFGSMYMYYDDDDLSTAYVYGYESVDSDSSYRDLYNAIVNGTSISPSNVHIYTGKEVNTRVFWAAGYSGKTGGTSQKPNFVFTRTTGAAVQTDFSNWGSSNLICAHIDTDAGNEGSTNDKQMFKGYAGVRFFNVTDSYAIIGIYCTKTDTQSGFGIIKFAIIPAAGYLTLHKDSTQSYTAGNSNYSLAGAEYTVYTDSACTTVATDVDGNKAVLTTNSNGDTNTLEMDIDTYYVKETKAATGYSLDSSVYTVSITSDNTEESPYKLSVKDAPETGYGQVIKVSANPDMTDGNDCYTVKNAQFKIYTDSACSKVATDVNGKDAVLTTDENGESNVVEMPLGDYYIKETQRPDGYYWDTQSGFDDSDFNVHSIKIEADKTTKVTVADNPMNDPLGITLYKIDAESGEAWPQGDADLAGAEFTIKFYAGDYSESEIQNMEPTRTWYLQTVAIGDKYYASFTADGSFEPDKSDELYYTNNGGITCPLGTYTIQEVGAPTGYLVEGDFYDGDDNKICQAGDVFYTQLLEGQEDGIWVYGGNVYTQEEQVIRGGLEIQKRDALSLRTDAEGSGNFEGIEYWIVSDAEDPVKVEGEWYEKGDTVKILITDETGYATTDSDTLPYGHYIVKEIQSGSSNTHATANGSTLLGNDGHSDSDVYTVVTEIPVFIDTEGEIKDLTGGEGSILEADEAMTDLPIRGDIAIKKHRASDQEPLSVPFKVTSMTTGESHVFWTDPNGDYSTDSTWIPHSYMTDAGEDWTDGFWFYGYEDWEQYLGTEDDYVDDTLGALPIDDYYLDELRCEENEGLELVHTTFHVYQDERVIDLGTMDDPDLYIDLGTTLTNDWTGEHQATIFENHDISLTDTISYEGLDVGEEYTMRGVLMDRETGEAVTDADGNEVTETVTFIPDEPDGEVEVTFTFNAYGMHDTYVVAFEYLYDAAGNCIGLHEDIDDEDQTVQLLVPTVWTYASETSTGLKSIEPKEEVEITDYLDITDLIVGHTYYVYGRAVNKDTGELILDHDGEPMELYIEFVADSEEMLLDIMNFHFNASDLGGQEVVFEEYIYADPDREILICEEEDLGSAEQTVYFLGDILLGTTLLDDETGEHVSYAGDHVSLTDEVEYTGAKVGETYTVTGTLMDKETGLAVTDEDGNEITAESEPFVAEDDHGFVEVTFEFDASALAGDSVVAYEFMYNSEGTLVSAHEDINDEDQTVEFPEIGTTLVDADTGFHGAVSDDHVTLVDTVEYEGLIPGYTYIVKGTLMDKSTEKALLDADGNEITAESEPFVAEESEGTVEVTFEFDASDIEDVYSVAFEYLYMVEEVEDEEETPEEHLVATHEDINDEGQTVKLAPVYIGTTLLDEASGTHEADADGRVTLVDTVEYDGLTAGETYTLEGTLMDKSTGTALKDADGNAVTAESTFTAESISGVAVVTFTFDATGMNGIFTVAFEQLYDNFGNLIASHEDINDEAQTVKLVHEEEEETPTTTVINNTNTSGEGPKTGDYTNIILWAVLGVLAVGGCTTGVVVYHRRKKVN